MSKIYDALRQAQLLRKQEQEPSARPAGPDATQPDAESTPTPPAADATDPGQSRSPFSKPSLRQTAPTTPGARDYKVVSVVSNKGGVGKTTIAVNLAVYLRAMREDEPVLLLGFDDQTTLDRMFEVDPPKPGEDMLAAFDAGSFRRFARMGQYGVDYVPTTRDLSALKARLSSPAELQTLLDDSDRKGFVLIDTKSDFEILTQGALDASDLILVVVKDHASLIEARRVFDRLEQLGRPRETARIVLSLVDRRVKYRGEETTDVLGHLLTEIRREGYPVFETFISRSPKVESLYTNPEGRAFSIIQGASGSMVHRQMRSLTDEVLGALSPSENP